MAALSLLWVDLRAKQSSPDLCSSLPRAYVAQRITRPCDVLPRMDMTRPWAVCFEYDFPRTHELQVLADAKRHQDTTPIILLTSSHSDQIAHWALRACVWEHLIKPLSVRSICNCLMTAYRAANVMMPVVASPIRNESSRVLEGELADDRLFQVISYVAANYMEKISLVTVARMCGLSSFQFSRNFKKTKGVTFRDFVIDFRIERAAQSLRASRTSVTEIAFEVGFNDLSYFARMFRRRFGVAPCQYRKAAEPHQLSLFE